MKCARWLSTGVVLLGALTAHGGLAAAAVDTTYADHRPLALSLQTPAPREAPENGLFQLDLNLSGDYQNPFDPAQIRVRAAFQSPHGEQIAVDGFLNQPFTRSLGNRQEVLHEAGPPEWQVRFSPHEPGMWRYRVRATDHTGTVEIPEASFRAVRSRNPGLVQQSRRNPTALALPGDRPFWPVGEDLGWAGRAGSFQFDDWFSKLGHAGANFVRIWMVNTNLGMEWTPNPAAPLPAGGFHGLGVYNLSNAWKLDTVLDSAARNGVDVMLTFGTYGELTTGGFFNEGLWPHNPYNAANGGPCASPSEFWTNTEARQFYRQRLRYIFSRYGWRRNVLAWEFWNEANPPLAWIREMSQYVKGTGAWAGQPADPFHHLLTNTYGSDAIWKLPEIDFTQTHSYGTGNTPDYAPVVERDAREFVPLGKPHVMAEFGIDWRASDSKYDPQGLGVNLHNALWASAVSGDAASAMIWWWDSYVDPKNLYGQFTAVRRFTERIPWTDGPWEQVALDAPHRVGGAETRSDLVVPAELGWGKSPVSDFTLSPQGLASGGLVPQFLYSPGKPDLRTTPTFHLKLDRPARFLVHINTVSADSRLQIRLDGQPALTLDLNPGPPPAGEAAPYKSTVYHPEWGSYQALFDQDYGIDVPAGDHTVTLETLSGDWVSIDRIVATGYRSSLYPEVNAYGLRHGKDAIVWLQNALHNWKSIFDGTPIPTLQGLQTAVRGLPDGTYRVEWWDNYRGTITRTEHLRSRDGNLSLTLPDLATDVAVRIRG